MEVWKDIKGYEGLYQVSNLGNIKSLRKWNGARGKHIYEPCERILTPTDNGYGYLIIGLKKNLARKNHYVHRLVAEAFIENPNNYPQINHKDFNRKNNNVDNLEWCTQKQNNQHSSVNMRKPKMNPKKSNTGERFIIYRESKKEFRVIINKKEYGTKRTIEEAIKLRDSILEESGYVEINSLRRN